MANPWIMRIAAVFSLLIALTSYRFLAFPLELGFPDFLDHITNRRTLFLMHIAAAPVALAVGAFQFMPKLRAKRSGLHRWMGRIYGLSILIGGIGALGIGVTAIGGPVAQVGFTLLAILWLATTANAVRLAMQRNIVEHRKWMIRSFALTFAAVTLRLQLPFFFAGGYDYAAASLWVAWTCWVPNLIVAERIIRTRPQPPLA